MNRLATGILGFLFASLLTVPVIIFGTERLVEALPQLLILAGAGSIGLVCVIAALYLSREKWLPLFFGVAGSRLDQVVDPIRRGIELSLQREGAEAAEQFSTAMQIFLAYQATSSLRRWFAATCIASLGGFVGVATAVLLSNQNKLLASQNKSIELQTAIARVAVTPEVSVKAKIERNDVDQLIQSVVVENRGAFVRGFDYEFTVSLSAFFSTEQRRWWYSIPMPKYYSVVTDNSNLGRGELLKLESLDLDLMGHFRTAFKRLGGEKGFDSLVTIERRLSISWTDQLGNSNQETYVITDSSERQLVKVEPKTEGVWIIGVQDELVATPENVQNGELIQILLARAAQSMVDFSDSPITD